MKTYNVTVAGIKRFKLCDIFISFAVSVSEGESMCSPTCIVQLGENALSKRFRGARNSQEFVNIWQEEVEPFLDSTTGEYTPGGQTKSTSTLPSASKKQMPQARPSAKRSSDDKSLDTEEMLPSKRRKKDDHEEDGMDKEIAEAFAGIYYRTQCILIFQYCARSPVIYP